MPVTKVGKKWEFGGKEYDTEEAANNAYKAYLAIKFGDTSKKGEDADKKEKKSEKKTKKSKKKKTDDDEHENEHDHTTG